MSASIVQPGQVWRRKSDGRLTTVISVQSDWQARASVLHQAQRRTHTETRNFIRKYEFVREVAS